MSLRLTIDAVELQPVIQTAIDLAVARLREELPTDAGGQILLTKAEAAKALGVSQSTVDRLRKDAGLPCMKLNGKALFRPESLREWAAGRESTS